MPKPITENTLFYGDNLVILREYVPDESVDLIYLDPPFNSNRTYNVLFRQESGAESEAQIAAFEDTWHWPSAAESYFEFLRTGPPHVTAMMSALHGFIGENQMMAYLVMMAVRLVELHRVLKPTGSLYLHCDPTASHYLKIMLDTVFGVQNFRNELVWQRTNVHSDSKTWSNVSDTIFFYTKSNRFTWNSIHLPHSEEHLKSKYSNLDPDGRRFTLSDMTSPNPRPNMMYEWKGFAFPPNGWRYSRETMARLDAEGRIWYPADKSKRPRLKRYLDEMPGTLVSNVWTDINPINSQAAERLGYPTQKPVALLDRIIAASSNPGDWVLDPFCGCGTAIAAAQKLDRRWIGIDITHLAITLQKNRLKSAFPDARYNVIGEPTSLSDARRLAEEDRFQFQWWAVSLVEAQPYGGDSSGRQGKKGADKGVDGIITFVDDRASGRAKQIIVQVKSGHVNAGDVRDLIGTMAGRKAEMGVFLTLENPTKAMISAAAEAGYYFSAGWNRSYPRVQILTIGGLLNGSVRPDTPPTEPPFKQARREREVGPEQGGLFD
jgi:site-specific DNA-methyltransferase (adenine-specific)